MTLYKVKEPVTQPCGSCMGNGCQTCRGSGEETVALEHWHCSSCLAAGEDDPGDECPSCGDDVAMVCDSMPDDDGFDPDDYEPETADDLYGPEVF